MTDDHSEALYAAALAGGNTVNPRHLCRPGRTRLGLAADIAKGLIRGATIMLVGSVIGEHLPLPGEATAADEFQFAIAITLTVLALTHGGLLALDDWRATRQMKRRAAIERRVILGEEML